MKHTPHLITLGLLAAGLLTGSATAATLNASKNDTQVAALDLDATYDDWARWTTNAPTATSEKAGATIINTTFSGVLGAPPTNANSGLHTFVQESALLTAYTRIRHSSTATANQDPSLTLSFDLVADTDYAIDIYVRLNTTANHSGVKFTANLGGDQSVFSIPHNGVTQASIYTLNVTDLTADGTLTIKLDNDGGANNNGFKAIRVPAVGVAATSASSAATTPSSVFTSTTS